MMYSLLSSHVRSGDGRSGTYRLAIHHAASASPMPHKGNATFMNRFFTSCPPGRFGWPGDRSAQLARLFTANDLAYFSGSLPSITLSKSVIDVSSCTATLTPSSFIASR